jgi:serine protease AprX
MPATRAVLSSRARLPIIGALLACAALTPSSEAVRAASESGRKMGTLARSRAARTDGQSTVILRAADRTAARAAVLEAGGRLGRALPKIDGQVATVPNSALASLADNPAIQWISLDRVAVGANERTGATVGATAIRQELGLDGAGVGIAVVDSGVAYHDDLADASGPQRVDRFVDFVGGQTTPYDDYGHGTHVAGIIAGNGYDSDGRRTGIAPAARLIVLKALDGSGTGRISDVIAALEYAIDNRDALNIRVINLSIASGV